MLSVQIPPSTITLAEFNSPTNKDTITKKKNRCPCCNKKLGLIVFSCKCGENFCAEHRLSDSHNCSFDYQAENRRKLSLDLVKVESKKIDKI